MDECNNTRQDDDWEENMIGTPEPETKMMNPLDIESSTFATTTIVQDESSLPPTSSKNCCVKMWQYEGLPEAKGYAILACGRGVAVMSNGKDISV